VRYFGHLRGRTGYSARAGKRSTLIAVIDPDNAVGTPIPVSKIVEVTRRGGLGPYRNIVGKPVRDLANLHRRTKWLTPTQRPKFRSCWPLSLMIGSPTPEPALSGLRRGAARSPDCGVTFCGTRKPGTPTSVYAPQGAI
jgi:hypothetical protein